MKKIRELCACQKALDNFIMDKHGLDDTHEIYEKRKIALLGEIGELGNEIRFFKYWSDKPMSDKQIILQEASDVLHFALSILNYAPKEFEIHDMTLEDCFQKSEDFKLIAKEMTDMFLNMYSDALIGQAGLVIVGLCCVMKELGYTAEEFEFGYFSKHDINYSRQENGY